MKIPGAWTQLVSQRFESVPWLAQLGEGALSEVLEAAERVRFRPGQTIVRELEVGDGLFLILEGRAKVTVGLEAEDRRELSMLGPGAAVGELAVLTRDLRSATVTAVEEVRALRIDRLEFEQLLRRHPRIAVHFVGEIASRLGDTDRALDAVLNSARHPGSLGELPIDPAHKRGALRRAWLELVASHKNELPFIAMVSFLVTLAGIQLLVHALRAAGVELFTLLRAAYTTGFGLVVVSVALSLLRFSSPMRKLIALSYGSGFALIVNELSVFLAFDTFYLDMTTRDPQLRFSVESLYQRSESDWAIAIMLLVLAQVTYLRRFYRRMAFLLSARVRAALSRKPK